MTIFYEDRLLNKLEKYPAYRDSGVEWLGEIPAGWGVKRIKSLSRVKRGASPRPIDNPKYFDDDGEFAWVRIADVSANEHYLANTTQRLSKLGASLSVKIMPNELMLSIAGTVGKPMISNIKCCIHDGFVYFPDLKKSIGYIYRIFETGAPYAGLGKFGTQLNLNTETVGNISIPYPPLPEQTAIANFLDEKAAKIDTAIAQKQQMISLLKERKQILIQNAVTKGINPDVKMKDSGVEWIGEIPEGWEILPNKVLFQESKIGGDDSLPLLSVSLHTGVSSGELDEEENIRGKVKIEDKSSYKRVKPHYIAYNMMRAWQGAIGAVSIEGMVSPAYVVAIPNEKVIDSVYFEFQYRTSLFIQQMSRFSKGITDFRKRLYWNEFKQLVTIIPSLFVQQAIVEHIETQSAKIDTSISLQQQQIAKLKEYKSTLIDSAVTGKIKVG